MGVEICDTLEQALKHEEGTTIDIIGLTISIQESITDNKSEPYIYGEIRDSTATLDFKKWKTSLSELLPNGEELQKNEVVKIRGEIKVFKKRKQVIISKIKTVEEDKTNFFPKEEISSDTFDKVIAFLKERLLDKEFITILNSFVDEYEDKIKTIPASKRIHHTKKHGLLLHLKKMLLLSERICQLYPSINSDILYLGLFLHDIGKIFELEYQDDGVVEYSDIGILLGHEVIGVIMLFSKCNDLEIKKSKKILNLSHVILAHAGKYSQKEPMTLEAEMVNYIDLIDSRAYIYDETIKRNQDNTNKILNPIVPRNKKIFNSNL